MAIAQAKGRVLPLWWYGGPAKINVFQVVHLACLGSFLVFFAALREVMVNHLRTYLNVLWHLLDHSTVPW